jgi:hypothetical protein
MSDTTVGPGGAPLPLYTTNPVAAASHPPGTPVYRSGGKVVAAIATSAAASNCVGLQGHQSAADERVFVQFAGLLTLPTTEWDAITDQTGGLTEGAYYYVSDADAGELTTTPPSGGAGHYVAPVGVAWSANAMLILPQASVVSGG